MTGSDPRRLNVHEDVSPRQMWNGLSVVILGDLWSISVAVGLFLMAYSLLFGFTPDALAVGLSAIALIFAFDVATIFRNTVLYGYPFR